MTLSKDHGQKQAAPATANPSPSTNTKPETTITRTLYEIHTLESQCAAPTPTGHSDNNTDNKSGGSHDKGDGDVDTNVHGNKDQGAAAPANGSQGKPTFVTKGSNGEATPCTKGSNGKATPITTGSNLSLIHI